MPENFKNNLIDIFVKNGLSEYINEKSIEKFEFLYKKLILTNEKFNLTAVKDEKGVILKHFADSLLICKYIPNNARVIDIGCGAGFPSLPLAIVRQDIKILAMDSTAKKVDYVNECAKEMEFKNVEAVCERAEILANNIKYREKFDVSTARAVAPLSVLAELCIPFVKKSGCFVAMKAQNSDEEERQASNMVKLLGCEKSFSQEIILTDGTDNMTRRIVCYTKIALTDNKYPRSYAQIVKQKMQM